MTSFDNLERVEVQKKLMADLHTRGMPFSSRKEKVAYCEEFYRSLGVEHGRNIGRIPIHISSAVRHFFHNNLQIGDVPKWARDDAALITMFIEVLRVYGPSKAIVKARKGTLENPRKIQIIPPEDREHFVHLLDGIELSSDEEIVVKRPRKQKNCSPQESSMAVDVRREQERRETQLKQILSAITGNGVNQNSDNNPVQVMLALLMASQPNQTIVIPSNTANNPAKFESCSAAVHSPALFAALSTAPTAAVTSVEGKENSQPKPSLKHSCTMESILERIKKTKRSPLQEGERS